MKELMNDPSVGAYHLSNDPKIKLIVSIIVLIMLLGMFAILWLDVVKYVLKKETEGSLNSLTRPFLLSITRPFEKYLPKENIELFQDILEKNKAVQNEEESNKIVPSLVSLYMLNKLKDIQASINILCLCIFIYTLFNIWEFAFEGFALIPIYIATALILLLYVNKRIIKYRSEKGWLGIDTYEAKQIIKFMLNKAEQNNNFKGPNGHIRIIAEVKESTEKSPLIIPGLSPSIN